MTVRRGRCNNIGLCDNATRQRIIEVPEGEPFICPKCEAELTSVEDRKVQRSATALALPIVAITLAVIAVAFGVWDLYLRPAATPAAQTAAPAQPQVAAVTPAPSPASAPAPEAAAPAVAPTPAPTPPASTTTPEAAPPAQTAVPEPALPQASAPAPSPQVATATPAPAPAPPPTPAPPTAAPETAPAAPAPAAEAAPSDPAQRVQAFLGNATRVPFTFNFRSGVVDLTGRGERELERLVGYLRQHHATGDRLYLAGFTDNQGDTAANEAVSQKRVAAVAAALTQAGITPAHVASFGAEMPVADNATQAGRDRNRRVEVYLAP